MTINPFVGGLAIGAVAVAITIMVCNYLMKRMADRYEVRLRSRDTRIQILLGRIDEMEKRSHRKDLMRQVEKPLH